LGRISHTFKSPSEITTCKAVVIIDIACLHRQIQLSATEFYNEQIARNRGKKALRAVEARTTFQEPLFSQEIMVKTGHHMDPRTSISHIRQLSEILELSIRPEALASLVATGTMMIANAARGCGEPRCAWDSSGLALMDRHQTEGPSTILLIDIGGTHTKVALTHEGNEFEFLFDDPNESFRPAGPHDGLALRAFLDTLLCQIAEAAPTLVRNPVPVRVGVIWSNQIRTRPLVTPELSGITGIVCGLHGGGYRKGEWFLEGLHDGHDIGQEFQHALDSSGINADVLVIGNDTVFTLFAQPCSHAGVVVSSGANCTLVGAGVGGEYTIYNSELGGMLLLPDSMLSRGDRIYSTSRESASIAIEELCGGAWFRDLCISHIEALTEVPEGRALLPIRAAIRQGTLSFTNSSLSALLSDNKVIPTEFANYDHSAIETLTALVGALVHRAGALAATIIYLSVCSQIKRGNLAPTISLDSSMARHFVGYFTSIEAHLKYLMQDVSTFSLHLVKPIKLAGGAEITVPMVGLARALREYRKPNLTEHADGTP
jgi:hypothetical protein